VSRGLGRVQRMVLVALQAREGISNLETLAHVVAGTLDGLHPDGPREVPPTVYKAVARAVAALERRGLVTGEVKGYYDLRDSGDRGYPHRIKTVRLNGGPMNGGPMNGE
jgi:hypothetical protein